MCGTCPVVFLAVAAIAFCAAFAALVTTRLERMAAAVGVVGSALAAHALAVTGPAAAAVLLVCTVAMMAVVLGAVAVLEVDARPRRRLQVWKLALLLPIVGVAALVVLGGQGLEGASLAPSGRATAIAALTVGMAAVAIPLLVRRTQGGSPPEGGS
jgi:hypothetical protein